MLKAPERKYFYNIDFLRFLFAIFVVNCHLFVNYVLGPSKDVYTNYISATRNGFLAVDYFFIIAGFFLLYSFKNESTIDFIKKKICKFWPLILFIFLLDLLVFSITGLNFVWGANFLALFFLENIGITLQKSNLGITWFLSSLLFVSVFYFYLFKHYEKKNFNLVVCILTFFAYIFCIQSTKGLLHLRFEIFDTFFNVGLMRATAGMGLGIILYNIYISNSISKLKPSLFYSFVEAGLLSFVIYYTGFNQLVFKNNIILVLAFACLFYLFILQRGFVSRFLNNKKLAILGEYALAIYLVHPCVLFLFRKLVFIDNVKWVSHHSLMALAFFYVTVFLIAIFAHHFIEKPGLKFLSKKLF